MRRRLGSRASFSGRSVKIHLGRTISPAEHCWLWHTGERMIGMRTQKVVMRGGTSFRKMFVKRSTVSVLYRIPSCLLLLQRASICLQLPCLLPCRLHHRSSRLVLFSRSQFLQILCCPTFQFVRPFSRKGRRSRHTQPYPRMRGCYQ